MSSPSQQDALDSTTLASFRESFESSPKSVLASNVVTAAAVRDVAIKRDVEARHDHNFSVRLADSKPVTSQAASGRCWLFAACNTARVPLATEHKLAEVELSQSFLFFHDKVERANYFLTAILDTLDEPLDSRLIAFLLTAPMNDGGQFDMIVNIVDKYGLVPKAAYGESVSSSSSRPMNWLLTCKLREFACALRTRHAEGASMEELRTLKKGQMEEIYRILCIFLGPPPTQFDWRFQNKDKEFKAFRNMTPQSFADLVGFQPADYVSLVNDPRNEYNRLLTVEYLGNVVGGRSVRYVNVSIDVIKQYVVAVLKDETPVWFGCDVGKHFHRKKGILDTELFCYEEMFDTTFAMTKAQRLEYGESLMTHAMVFTGVDLDEDGNLQSARVENSWGTKGGDNGYLSMSAKWFDEYVYQVAIHKKYLPEEILAVLEQEPVVLPAWDPMGALA